MSDDTKHKPDFIEQTILLPRSLWSRLEAACEANDREPSEFIAEAVRGLLSRGSAPASVGGTIGDPGSRVASLAAGIDPGPMEPVSEDGSIPDIEAKLADLYEEPLDSAELRDKFLQVMAKVEAKDHFIERHSEKVASLARHTAEALDQSAREVLAIETAGLVHDIGKSLVPEAILGKKGRLTADEWATVQRYPEFSARILEPFEHLDEVIPLVRHHQERWDGSGYPDGLQEDAIPLGAQIVGICDVYDVLTSDRAYRPALPPDVARRTIEGGIGRLWNPDIAEVLLEQVLGS